MGYITEHSPYNYAYERGYKMKLTDMLYKYHERTTALKSSGTTRFELGHIVSLQKCFDALNLVESNQLTLDAAYRIIRWYREHTSNSNNSINKRIAHLKRVLRFFEIRSSFIDVEFLKKDTLPYMRFRDNELKTIYKCVDLSTNSHRATKNTILYKLLVYMLLDTGLRIGELLEVKRDNVDIVNRVILLEHTKNGKKEPIPFSSFSSELLTEVLSLNYHDKWLFWNTLKDRKLNYTIDVRNYMRHLKEKTGIDRLHPHRFRKSYGTMIYQETKDIRLVQKLLRHSRASTTELYIQEGIDEVHQRYQDAAIVFGKVR